MAAVVDPLERPFHETSEQSLLSDMLRNKSHQSHLGWPIILVITFTIIQIFYSFSTARSLKVMRHNNPDALDDHVWYAPSAVFYHVKSTVRTFFGIERVLLMGFPPPPPDFWACCRFGATGAGTDDIASSKSKLKSKSSSVVSQSSSLSIGTL